MLSKLPVLPLVPGQCPDGSSQGCARRSLGVHVELAHVGAVHVVPELKAHGAAAGIGGRDEPRFGVSVVVVRLHVHVVTWNKVLGSQSGFADDDDELMLNVLRCQLTLGTSCDQCRSTVQ